MTSSPLGSQAGPSSSPGPGSSSGSGSFFTAPATAAAANKGAATQSSSFDIVESYNSHLSASSDLPMPIAAIFALCDLVSRSSAETTSELMVTIRRGCEELKSKLPNPVPAQAGMDLFQRFVVMKNWEGPSGIGSRRGSASTSYKDDFQAHKQSLVALAREFAQNTAPSCRERITELAMPFIRDDAVILTHSYSRVVMQVLIKAAKRYNKRISVYVTEARATGLGMKTYEELTAAGIPCTMVLDSAVAYMISKVDMVLTGAEGVVESGGILNALGTYQIALIAKAANKPFYACAESFKFLRLFPLSQDDLPVPRRNILNFRSNTVPVSESKTTSSTKEETSPAAKQSTPKLMTQEMLEANPAVDYTLPHLISFLLTDSGVLTPSGVGDALLAVYGGPD